MANYKLLDNGNINKALWFVDQVPLLFICWDCSITWVAGTRGTSLRKPLWLSHVLNGPFPYTCCGWPKPVIVLKIYLFIWKQKKRREWDKVHPPTSSLSRWPQQLGLVQGWNSFLVSPVNGKGPSTWAIIHYVPVLWQEAELEVE